jgi:hypothetical protein
MKALLIFVDPLKDFNTEHKTLAKIQIDWSLEFCKPEDIMLVTNFPFRYKGIQSYIVEDDCYYPPFNRATKIRVINRLFEKGLINEEFWFHDFDVFQLEPMESKSDFAIVLYGTNPKCTADKWNAGSFFFNNNAKDIFKSIEETMWKFNMDEENALTLMMRGGFKNYEELDYSYCVHVYNTKVKKPKALHFHPRKKHHRELFKNLPKKLEESFNLHIPK